MVKKDRPVILVGGAPTTGKSTMAEALSRHLGLPWISTDQIRGIMRTVARKEDFPALFSQAGFLAEDYLIGYTSEQIVQKEFAESEAAWPAVKTFIEEDYTWERGFIIEGVGIQPNLVRRDFGASRNVKAVFLVDEDADRIRDVVFTRGLWADAGDYPDSVKEKEVEWVSLYSHRLKAEVVRHGYPWVEVQKRKDDLAVVLAVLGLKERYVHP